MGFIKRNFAALKLYIVLTYPTSSIVIHNMASISDSKNRLLEKFRKRRDTLCKKANELHLFTKADVYLLIRLDGNYFGYKSPNESKWPPSYTEIVSAERKCRT